LAYHALQFGDACLILIDIAVACEGALTVLRVLRAPLANESRMNVMLASSLGNGFSSFDFTNDLSLNSLVN
jgi:hypothetical protein